MQPLPLTPDPCRCPSPEYAREHCTRPGRPANSRDWHLCSHTQQKGLPAISAARSDAYRRKWDGLPGADQVRARAVRCQHRSPEPVRQDAVGCCGGSLTLVDVYDCACAERGIPETTARTCLECPHHVPITGYVRQHGDPKVGLVIGSCGFPNLVELQIRAARMLCGETLPILVSDDTDDPEKVARLRQLGVRYGNVTLWRNAEKMGHAPGDVVALWKGLEWAAVRNLRVIIKVSQRLLWLTPRWLQDVAAGLLQSGKVWASMPCLQGQQRFAFRSEAIALDVLQAHRPDVLAELEPSRLAAAGTWTREHVAGMIAESFLWDLFARLGWPMFEWSALGEQRYESRAPAHLWHCADGMAKYAQVAAEYGVELGVERPGVGG